MSIWTQDSYSYYSKICYCILKISYKMQEDNFVDKVETTDLVIVGGETTGGTAAIRASENKDVRITVVTKGQDIGRSGATMLAHEPLSSCVIDSRSAHQVLGLKEGDPRDSPEAFFEDMLITGEYLNDQEAALVIARNAALVAKEMQSWGFEWNSDIVDRSMGHRYPRDYYGKRAWGFQYARLIPSLLKSRSNVEILNESTAVDLLVNHGRISGIIVFDHESGNLVLYRCKAVILACGGVQNLFVHATTGRELTGDAYAMAFRAGAPIIDLEFTLFLHSIIWPEGAAHDPFALFQCFRHTGVLLNKYGERFMKKWDPENLEQNRIMGVIASAVEILEGRGGKHGGLYFTINHLPRNLVDYQAEWGKLKNWHELSTNYDYGEYVEWMKKGQALEMSLSAHYNEGGLKIEQPNCRTPNIKGLFAAGEAAGGADGSRRGAGN